jgi:hypothetical protein
MPMPARKRFRFPPSLEPSMSSPSAKELRKSVLNAVIGMIATLFLVFGTGLWNLKENASAHKLDIQTVNANVERVLDLLCEGRTPQPRQCLDRPGNTAGGDVDPRDP